MQLCRNVVPACWRSRSFSGNRKTQLQLRGNHNYVLNLCCHRYFSHAWEFTFYGSVALSRKSLINFTKLKLKKRSTEGWFVCKPCHRGAEPRQHAGVTSSRCAYDSEGNDSKNSSGGKVNTCIIRLRVPFRKGFFFTAVKWIHFLLRVKIQIKVLMDLLCLEFIYSIASLSVISIPFSSYVRKENAPYIYTGKFRNP